MGDSWATPGRIYGPTLGLVNDIVDCDRDKVIIMSASFLFFEFPLRYVTGIERN